MADGRRARPFSGAPKFGLTVRLGLGLRERLEAAAARAGVKPTTWAREALERAVSEGERSAFEARGAGTGLLAGDHTSRGNSAPRVVR